MDKQVDIQGVKNYIADIESYLLRSYILPNIDIVREVYMPMLIDRIINKNGTIELLGTNTKLSTKEIEKNKNNIINILAKTTKPENIVVTLPPVTDDKGQVIGPLKFDLNNMVGASLNSKILRFGSYLTGLSLNILKPTEINEEYKLKLKEKALNFMPDKFFYIYTRLYEAKTKKDKDKIMAEVNIYSIALLPYIITNMSKVIGNGKVKEFKIGKENIHKYLDLCLNEIGNRIERQAKILREEAMQNADKELSSRTVSRGTKR